MKTPGFTAEASLEQSSNDYFMAQPSREWSKRDQVVPQRPIILDGFCIGNGSYCCFRGPDGKWSCGRTIST